LLTGGQDRNYAFGLATAMVKKGVRNRRFIGNDRVGQYLSSIRPEAGVPRSGRDTAAGSQLFEEFIPVVELLWAIDPVRYVCQPRLVHILWNNKFEYFDRTLLMLYYRLCGMKIVFTAHT